MERRQSDREDERQPRRQSARTEHAEGDRSQRFYFGPWIFNIDRAQALIADRSRATLSVPVAAWARAYGLDSLGEEHGSISLVGPGPDFDPEYAMTTDLTEPVIVATMRSDDTSQVAPLLIDGTHRLYRAYKEGIDTLPAHLLNVEETLMIREEC